MYFTTFFVTEKEKKKERKKERKKYYLLSRGHNWHVRQNMITSRESQRDYLSKIVRVKIFFFFSQQCRQKHFHL
jgi:hypothetical protein